jgi:hypothetical protein
LVAVGGACAVRETTSIVDDLGSSRDAIRPLGRSPVSLAAQSENVPTNGTDASGRVDFAQTYASPTLVDIEMSGWITRTNKYTGQKDYIGPGGFNNCNSGATVLRWNGGGGWWLTNDCTNGKSPVSGAKEIVGAVYADRGAMGTTCGQGPAPCFTFSGNILVTLTPRVGTLSLSCTPTEFTATTKVSCTLASSLPNYTSNITWTWTDPSPATESMNCLTSCDFDSRSWSGTVTVTANVNGDVKTATASVRRRCITGDSVIDANDDRRAHLASVWSAGGDRDSVGTLIGTLSRREAGQLGRPGTSWQPLMRADTGRRCQIAFSQLPVGITDYIHSHPWPSRTLIPFSCWGLPGDRWGPAASGLSLPDALTAARIRAALGTPFRVSAIDRDSIYYIDASQVGGYDSTLVGGEYRFELLDPSGALTRQRRFSRTGPYGCTLP